VRLDLAVVGRGEAPSAWHRQAATADATALPPARAPPALR